MNAIIPGKLPFPSFFPFISSFSLPSLFFCSFSAAWMIAQQKEQEKEAGKLESSGDHEEKKEVRLLLAFFFCCFCLPFHQPLFPLCLDRSFWLSLSIRLPRQVVNRLSCTFYFLYGCSNTLKNVFFCLKLSFFSCLQVKARVFLFSTQAQAQAQTPVQIPRLLFPKETKEEEVGQPVRQRRGGRDRVGEAQETKAFREALRHVDGGCGAPGCVHGHHPTRRLPALQLLHAQPDRQAVSG